jgi:hypothetical protein
MALLGMLCIVVGCRVVGFNGLSPETMGSLRKRALEFAAKSWKVHFFFCVFLGIVFWILRLYQVRAGLYFHYADKDYAAVSGIASIFTYLSMELKFFIVPLVALAFFGTKSKLVKIACLAIISAEFFDSFLTSTRTQFLTLAVQTIAVYCLFVKIRTRKLILSFTAFIFVFFLILQPLIFAYRVTTKQISFRGDLAEAIWGEVWYDTVDSIRTGEAELETEGWGDRDVKYRLAAQGYLSALSGAVLVDGTTPPYGEFTLRNAASVVPTILWEDKWKHAIMLMKAETPRYYKIPRTDYMQTLTAHFFSDAGIVGVIVGMLVFGVYLGLLVRFLLIGSSKKPIRLILFTFLIAKIYFDGVGDFRDYFLMPWRTGLVVYLVIAATLYLLSARSREAMVR